MISIQDLSIQYGGRVLFEQVSFLIRNRDKIGLVGKNGAGKSTLLKIISGQVKSDKGEIHKPKDVQVGYLKQEVHFEQDRTVREEVYAGLGALRELQNRIDEINAELGERTDYESEAYEKLLLELNNCTDRFNLLGGYNADEQINRVLVGLGFKEPELDQPLSAFSGGWQMRVELAKVLLAKPELLLLDEPTNHLDLSSIFWLERYLKEYNGALLLISHDRAFLDQVTSRTIEISKRKAYDYPFPYSKYLDARLEEVERQLAEAKEQEKFVQKTQVLINKFRAKKNKAAFAQTLIKKLDRMERIEVDDPESSEMNIQFPPSPRSGKVVLEAKNLGKSYGEKCILKEQNFMLNRGERVALVGRNGAGKTTLIKSLLDEVEIEGEVAYGHNVMVGYYAQNQTEHLDPNKTVFETIDEQATGDMRSKVRGLLGSFLFSGDDIEKYVKVLSGGEKARLALCKLLLEPYNFLILDEPTNHLDIPSKEVLKSALQTFDGTLVLVSHDRDFLDGLTDRVYELDNGDLRIHHGSVQEYLERSQLVSLQDKHVAEKGGKKQDASGGKEAYEAKKARDREKRRLENLTKKCEKEITRCEQKLKEMDEVLAGLDYGDPEKSNTVLAEYAAVKEELDQHTQRWEEAMLELEVMES